MRTPQRLPSPVRVKRGGLARRSGRMAEAVAAAWLMLKGWRIVGFRLKSGGTEIDLLAVRGKILAVVEVKRRASLESAIESISHQQRARLCRAAEQLVAGKRGLSGLSVRLDMVALAPGRLPRHIPDAWRNGD